MLGSKSKDLAPLTWGDVTLAIHEYGKQRWPGRTIVTISVPRGTKDGYVLFAQESADAV
jgi:hypothetical protein